MKLPTIDVTKQIPRFIANDKTGYAIAKAIEVCLVRASESIRRGIGELQDVHMMSEWRLDEMAWEWNISWYDYSADIETKRRTIEGMHKVHQHVGTRSAIRDVLEQYFGDGEVEEWYEYGGAPYHFRVTSANPRATTESAKQLTAMVEMLKNVRSVFDGAIIENSFVTTQKSGQHMLIANLIDFTERL